MKIVIDKIERECQVLLAPKGAFCIWDIDEGSFGFPEFVVIAPAITPEETMCGNIITCPVNCTDDRGYEEAEIGEISTEIELCVFKELVLGYWLEMECDTIETAAICLYERFLQHGTAIDYDLKSYMDNKEYNYDKFFTFTKEDD